MGRPGMSRPEEEVHTAMCMTCGCREWDNDHGNPKNITLHRFLDAAEAGGVTVEEALEHLRDGVQTACRRARGRESVAAKG
jgi:hypothetical protein